MDSKRETYLFELQCLTVVYISLVVFSIHFVRDLSKNNISDKKFY